MWLESHTFLLPPALFLLSFFVSLFPVVFLGLRHLCPVGRSGTPQENTTPQFFIPTPLESFKGGLVSFFFWEVDCGWLGGHYIPTLLLW